MTSGGLREAREFRVPFPTVWNGRKAEAGEGRCLRRPTLSLCRQEVGNGHQAAAQGT